MTISAITMTMMVYAGDDDDNAGDDDDNAGDDDDNAGDDDDNDDDGRGLKLAESESGGRKLALARLTACTRNHQQRCTRAPTNDCLHQKPPTEVHQSTNQ